MVLPPAVRDLLVVAHGDLTDARRSRKTVLLVILYLVGSVSASLLFAYVLHKIETQIASALQAPESASTGAMTAKLWEQRQFRQMVIGLVGDADLGERLLRVPPLALFYGWIAFAFGPLLLALNASESVAAEVGSGAARYSLTRTGRGSWCLGKAASQALQGLIAILIGAVGAWVVGLVRLAGFEALPAALSMLGFAVRAWVYSLAFLGLALGISMLTRSQHLARGLTVLGLVAVSALAGLADHYAGPGWARAWEIVHLLMPGAHRLELWYPDPAHQIPAMAYLVGLGGLYLVAGFAAFRRRDL